MRSIALATCVLALASCHTQQPATSEPVADVAYEIHFVPAGANDKSYILVKLTLPADTPYTLVASPRVLPPDFANCVEPDYAIIQQSNARLASKPVQGAIAAFEATGEGPLSVTYRVRPRLDGLDFPIMAVTGCQPIIWGGDSVFFDPRSLLFHLRVIEGDRLARPDSVSLAFPDLPHDWKIHATMGSPEPGNRYSGRKLESLRDGYFAVGKFTTAQVTTPEGRLTVVASPNASAMSARVVQLAADATRHFVSTWGASGMSDYWQFLIATGGGDDEFGHLTGQSRFPSSNYVIFQNVASEVTIANGVVHEIAHNWTPGMLARELSAFDWLREGLTDYLTEKTMRTLGAARPGSMINRLNLALQNLAIASMPQLEDYDEGFVLSFALDTPSLTGAKGVVGIEAFVKTLIDGRDAITTKAAVIDAAKALGLVPATSPATRASIRLFCQVELDGERYRLMKGRWPSYDLGFSMAKNQRDVIASVAPGSNAEKAGLASGLVRLSKGGDVGNIHDPVVLDVRDASGARRSITYLPHGPLGKVAYAQYVRASLPPTAEGAPETDCR